MNLPEKIFEALAQERQRSGPISRERWLAIAAVTIAEDKVSRKRAPRTTTPVARPRNELFDALATACGCRDVSQLTRNGSKAVGVALADIREVCPELTVQDINRVVQAYKQRHPQWPCTAPAIAKNWAEFAQTDRTITAKTDVYQEPPGWKDSEAAMNALRTTPETWAIICERGWFELGSDIRADILKALL